jgi:PTH1 family peptidyl-tRNA hydrolase
MRTLVPLGNPGPEYAATRHNLGRLLLQRWIGDRGLRPVVARQSASGRVYTLTPGLQALVPGTYMNLSGQAVDEAVADGVPVESLVLLVDDKDLPLGLGRFRLAGTDGGHNGLRSIHEALATENVPRLRLGIGPFTRPLHEFVLGEWTESEWEIIDRLDEPFGRFMDLLEGAEGFEGLPGKVNGEAFWAAS